MANERSEFRMGPFSVGDLLALLAIVFSSGATWAQVLQDGRDITSLDERLKLLERDAPEKYVRRDDYRDDIQEIKSLLRGISTRLDGKQDRDAAATERHR